MQPSATAIQPSCTGGQGNCLFSVNKLEKEEEEEEEVEITTKMQSSVAMQHSCARRPIKAIVSFQ